MVAPRSVRANHLVQMDIWKPVDALKHFNAPVTNGQIPIVLIPTDPIVMTFFMKVPSGVWVLKQHWNAHDVHMCPTSDNVMVDIDIFISFQIEPTENDVYAFVYSLGAHRFDELLYSITEEAIRGLVHSVRHDQVHDLREEFAVGMKTDLNEKLKSFGVFIQNVKVTNVNLPAALAKTLEETTVFKTRMQEQEKNQENQMRILLNRETQTLTALEKSNERAIQDLQAEKHVSQNDNKVKAAEGHKDNALASATARALEHKTLPSIQLKNLQANYDRYVEAAKVSAEATIQAAEKQAVMILATADVEEASADFLLARRNFDYNDKKIDVEASLLEAVPLVISGKNGDHVIQRTVLEAVGSTMKV